MRTKQKKAIAFVVSLCMSLYCIPFQFMTLVRADSGQAKMIYAANTGEESYEDYEFVEIGEDAPEGKELLACYVFGGEYQLEEVPDCVILVDGADVSFEYAVDVFDLAYVINSGSIACDAVTVSSEGDESVPFDDAGEAYDYFMETVDGKLYCYTLTGDWTVPEYHDFNAQAITGSEGYTFTAYSGIIVNDFQVSSAEINAELKITEQGQYGCTALSGTGAVIFEDGVYVYDCDGLVRWDSNANDYVPAFVSYNTVQPGRYSYDPAVEGFLYEGYEEEEYAYVTVYYDNCSWSGEEAAVYINGEYIEPDGSMAFDPGTEISISVEGIERYSEVPHVIHIGGDIEPLDLYAMDNEECYYTLDNSGKYSIEIFWSEFERQGPDDWEFMLETNENGNGYIDLSDYDVYDGYVRAYTDPIDPGHKKFIICQDVFDEFLAVRFVIVPNEGDTFERFATEDAEFFADPVDGQNGFDAALVFDDVSDQWCYDITEVPERPWEPVRIAADFTGGDPGPHPGSDEMNINDRGFMFSIYDGEDYIYPDTNRLNYEDLADLDAISFRFEPDGDRQAYGVSIRMDGYASVVPFDEVTEDGYFITVYRPDDGWEIIREIEVIDYEGPMNGQYRVEWHGDEEPVTSLPMGEIMDFEPGETIEFTVDCDYYAIVVRTNFGEVINVEDLGDGSFSYTPETDEGFSIVFYMTYDHYRFDFMEWDWDNDCSVWFNFDHNGFGDWELYDHLEIIADGEAVEYAISGNQVRLVLGQDVDKIRINLNDLDFLADRWGYWLNGVDHSGFVGFDVDLDLHEGDNWIEDFTLYFERDGGDQPPRDGFTIIPMYDDQVYYSLDGSDFEPAEALEGYEYTIPGDLSDVSEITLYVPSEEQVDPNDLRYTQAHIDVPDDYHIIAMTAEEDGYYLTLELPEDGWPQFMRIELTDYSNPCDGQFRFDIRYDGIHDTQLVGYENGVSYDYEDGGTYTFSFDGDQPAVVVVVPNWVPEQNAETILQPDEDGLYTFEASGHQGIHIDAYLNMDQWDWDHFWPENLDEQYSYEFVFDHSGFDDVEELLSIEAVDVEDGVIGWMAYGDRVRVILSNEVDDITVSIALPDEYDEYFCRINNMDEEGTEFTVASRWTEERPEDYIEIVCRKTPRIGIALTENIEGLQYSVDGEEFLDPVWNDELGNLVVPYEEIDGCESVYFRIPDYAHPVESWHIAVMVDGDDGVGRYLLYEHVGTDGDDGCFTLNNADGVWPYLTWLEIHKWDCPAMNEFSVDCMTYTGQNEIEIGGLDLEEGYLSYELGDTIEFTADGAYCVVAEPNAYFTNSWGNYTYVDCDDGTYAYTPDNDLGFRIYVFPTQEDFDFWNLRAGDEQNSFDFLVGNMGVGQIDITNIVSVQAVVEGEPVDVDAYAALGAEAKVIYTWDAEGLTFTIDPELLPMDARLEILVNGVDITEEVIENGYTFYISNDEWASLNINIFGTSDYQPGIWIEDNGYGDPIFNDIWYAFDDSEEFTALEPRVQESEHGPWDTYVLPYVEIPEDAETVTLKITSDEVIQQASVWYATLDGNGGAMIRAYSDDGFYYVTLDLTRITLFDSDTHVNLMTEFEICDDEYVYNVIGRGDDITVNRSRENIGQVFQQGTDIEFTVEGDYYKVEAFCYGQVQELTPNSNGFFFYPMESAKWGVEINIYVTEAEYEYDHTPYIEWPNECVEINIFDEGFNGLISEDYVTVPEQDGVFNSWIAAGREKLEVCCYTSEYSSSVRTDSVTINIEKPQGCQLIYVNGELFDGGEYVWEIGWDNYDTKLDILFVGDGLVVEEPGWYQEEDGSWYYITDNYTRATGLTEIKGKMYFFNDDGIMQTGLQVIDGDTFYFSGSGAMITRKWQTVDGAAYYFTESGAAATGIYAVDGVKYYFDDSGVMQTGLVLDNGTLYFFDDEGAMVTGWKKVDEFWYYFDSANNGAGVTGFKDIGGKTYFFGTSEEFLGQMVTGLTEIDGEMYLFNDSGVMQKGWKKIDGLYHYFDKTSGFMVTGLQTISGKKYLFDIEGVMLTGWQTANGESYYFLDSGEMAADAFVNIESATFYFDGEGKIVENQWISKDGSDYYAGEYGEIAKGLQEIDNETYYFDDNGVMQKGWKKIDSLYHYFDKTSGIMVTGLQTISGKKYLFDEDGVMLTGWQTADGESYYFLASGAMAADAIVNVESATFYFDANGKIVENQWISKDGSYYYAGDYGEIAKGLQKIGKATYYFDENGVMQKGWQQIDGKYYYFKSSGAMVTGLQTISGKKYYFNDQGVMQTGWIKIDDQYYYFASSGAMQTGWQKISGKWYLFSDEGVMLTGWQKSGSSWYYFQASGAMATGWLKISDKWYYFGSSGAMATNWQKISNKWYYFGTSGVMATGWQEISGKWYYFKDGVMQTGTVKIGSKTYKFDSNGVWVS